MEGGREMNEKEINIAIAEACGWHDCSIVGEEPCGLQPAKTSLDDRYEFIPDYCNDLNAMHEAEEAIAGILWRDYFERLQRHGKASGVRATARERAEAFLRTIGKWKD